jgi:molybdopterin/thiamine biosynthesis adenylyltransferase
MVDSISAQISYMSGGAVLVPDPFWAREFELDHGGFTLLQVIGDRLRLLYRVEGCDQPDESVVARLTSSGAHRRSGTWVQLPEPPSPWPSHHAILEAARNVFPGLFSSARSELARKYKLKHVEQWIGVTFLEEGPRRGETRRAWVFAEVRLERGGAPELRRVVEAHPVTAEARALRTPELVGLAEARIAVVGAGSLGAPITLELAKAGVGQIFLVDRDSYQASNSVRHVLSTWDTGRSKAVGVAVAAEQLNPLIEITPQVTTINGSNAGDLLADAEVVVDTTGSQAVGRMLSRRCREMGKRFVVAGLTNGAYGGDLVILDPGGPCFMCFVMRQAADEIPSPASAPRSNATAHGCGYPTFAGAGFDATALAALVTRAVVGAGGWCAYPKPGYDWAVVNFRNGEPWRQGRLERHPGCPVCGHG